MPVIRVSKPDLERLVGRVLSNEEIMDLLPRVKCEVEVISEDGVIEYEATHDRPDLFSVEGLARALRGLLGLEMHRYSFVDEGYKAYAKSIPKRPWVAFAIVKDLDLDDEAVQQMMQLQEKLALTYGRRRRKASIGVYDLDRIKPPIYYELKSPVSTRFVPLNEVKEMSLQEILVETEKGRMYGYLLRGWDKYPVLRDSKGRILSMPPIINSEDTKVTVNTRNVLIDSTGLDPKTVVDVVTIMATSIAERSRTGRIVFVDTIYPDKSVLRAPNSKGRRIELSRSMVSEILGVEVPDEKIIESLARMGYNVSVEEDRIIAEAPCYRIDVFRDVDVVEDIAMAIGYEVIGRAAEEMPPATHPGRIHPLEFLSRIMRRILVGYGFVEVVNYMMSNPRIQLEMMGLRDEIILVENPKMEKYTGLRRWLTPGLLEVYFENYEKEPRIMIFEVGDVAIPDKKSETGARIERRMALLISHPKATLTDGIAYINVVLNRLKIRPVYKKAKIPGFLEQRTAKIMIGDVEVGFVGEIHPKILYERGAENPVVVAEITLDKLLEIISSQQT